MKKRRHSVIGSDGVHGYTEVIKRDVKYDYIELLELRLKVLNAMLRRIECFTTE